MVMYMLNQEPIKKRAGTQLNKLSPNGLEIFLMLLSNAHATNVERILLSHPNAK